MANSTDDLIDELGRQGFEVRRTKKGHYFVTKNGVPVTTISGTPSDHRSLKNSIAAARRHGFTWPPDRR